MVLEAYVIIFCLKNQLGNWIHYCTTYTNVYKYIRKFQLVYSRTPLIRPPSEIHCWGRMRGVVVGEGGRSSGVLLYF